MTEMSLWQMRCPPTGGEWSQPVSGRTCLLPPCIISHPSSLPLLLPLSFSPDCSQFRGVQQGVLPLYRAGSFDAVLCDPPFGERELVKGVAAAAARPGAVGRQNDPGIGGSGPSQEASSPQFNSRRRLVTASGSFLGSVVRLAGELLRPGGRLVTWMPLPEGRAGGGMDSGALSSARSQLEAHASAAGAGLRLRLLGQERRQGGLCRALAVFERDIGIVRGAEAELCQRQEEAEGSGAHGEGRGDVEGGGKGGANAEEGAKRGRDGGGEGEEARGLGLDEETQNEGGRKGGWGAGGVGGQEEERDGGVGKPEERGATGEGEEFEGREEGGGGGGEGEKSVVAPLWSVGDEGSAALCTPPGAVRPPWLQGFEDAALLLSSVPINDTDATRCGMSYGEAKALASGVALDVFRASWVGDAPAVAEYLKAGGSPHATDKK